jgi:hypothetical protein
MRLCTLAFHYPSSDEQNWPGPYIYTVYDRIFGDVPANNTVYTPYVYGSGQPY